MPLPEVFDRRSLLRLAADAGALAAAPLLSGAPAVFRVGIGNSSDPHSAAMRAIAASGEFPVVVGRTVIVKPNLVVGLPASTGATTDPQVVRAIVDTALAGGAAKVLIAEGASRMPAPWDVCGYSFFAGYDPLGRVKLVDLLGEPVTLAQVPLGYVYDSMYMPGVVLAPDVVFICAAKLKTHFLATVTLSTKNLFGLVPRGQYGVPGSPLPRNDPHARGMDQAIVDMNLLRPVHFAVIDGIWGMEGEGPVAGSPVAMNLALAGRNALAVDLVGCQAMQIPPDSVLHLAYAALRALGPWDIGKIQTAGDALSPRAFVRATSPPPLWAPLVNPQTISISAGEAATITYNLSTACRTRVEIVRVNDVTPVVTLIRLLHDWVQRPAGVEVLKWRGLAGNGLPVTPGEYMVRVSARYGDVGNPASASSWLRVTP
jgi:uncharacterized protein (DUF362 family)